MLSRLCVIALVIVAAIPAAAEGYFSFDGLPPKASIISCRGYRQDPVPTDVTTWGSVKARYR